MMKIANYNSKEIEEQVLNFWKEHETYTKAKKKGKGKEKFYYLDGPPYTSGRIHLGHVWGKALRDMVMRHRRMAGFDVWDRPGFDMHGLPTEHKAMARLNLKFKEEIERIGLEKFNTQCEQLAVETMNVMIDDFKRMGVWMDWDNPYVPVKNEFIEGVWWLVKKAHTDDRLYEGERTMHWCWHCETSLAKHDLEYKNVMDDSIFVKFRIRARPNEYLIIWTTTPWTIPFNLAIMANPELEYVRAQVGDEVWILAKGLAGPVIQAVAEKTFKVIETFFGDKLEGLEYEHPMYDEFKEIYDGIKAQAPRAHTVVLSDEYVTLDAGSGLVHCAPGCGPEDYEVGRKNSIPPLNMLDEAGYYKEGCGIFSGKHAKHQNHEFTESLKARDVIIAITPVDHEYAHCQRCHSPVVFRTTRQWFFKVEDLKEQMRESNRAVRWVPEWAGSRQFDSWLANLRDNSITRQNYWGTPAPIWKCTLCNHTEVIGSIKELRSFASDLPKSLHRPWIDQVVWEHDCGKGRKGVMRRLPDVLDVWIDAGTTSWTCLDFPQDEKNLKRLFPADFIVEGKDQIRGWFNLLLIASMMGMRKHSYKAVYMHGFINDALGRKMSKSQSNYILPEEYISTYGADALRLYMIGGANPGYDLNFNEEDLKVHSRNLIVLWNLHKYLIDAVELAGVSPAQVKKPRKKESFEIVEQFMLAKLHATIKKVSALYDAYLLDEVPAAIEDLFLTLSRTYVQLVREKLASGSEEDKRDAITVIYTTLLETLKMLYPVCPFITERIYQNMREPFGLAPESISLHEWPSHDDRMLDPQLEHHMSVVGDIVQGVLAAREKAQLGVRWPLQELVICTQDERAVAAVESLKDLVRSQVNVKEISIMAHFSHVDIKIRADFAKLGPDFGDAAPKIIARLMQESSSTILEHLTKQGKFIIKIDAKEYSVVKEHIIVERTVAAPWVESEFRSGHAYLHTRMSEALEAEGYSRELMRRVQSARKSAGLEKIDTISLFVKTDEELVSLLKGHAKAIKEKVGASIINISSNEPAAQHAHNIVDKIKHHQVSLHFNKV